MKVTAIITAGGRGTRFSGTGVPKQYLKLGGKPVLLYSLLAFQKAKPVGEIIVSASREYFDLIHRLAAQNKITKLTKLVEGGSTRFMSVKNAFRQADASKNDIVMVHDAARPNIDAGFVEKLVSGVKKYEALIPGNRIGETVKKENRGFVSETINREHLFTVQTPQVFRFGVLQSAYRKCGRKSDFTDEAALAEYAGFKVKITAGYKNNVKITTPDDFHILKSFSRFK